MKYILLIFCSLFSVNLGATDNSVKVNLAGRVFDKSTKEPVPGAIIYIPELKIGVYTDSLGRYIVKNLPATSVVLEVSCIAYKTVIEKVNLSVITVKDFELEQNITELNTVVVTGSSGAVELRRNPAAIVTISRKDLGRITTTNIIDAISTLPGISAVSTGPNISKPFIHGLGYNRVLTLYDGVRQEGQQWGDEHGIEVDENDIDRIEVVKGPASLIYGSDALAGVVNLIPAPAAPEDKITGSLMTNYQSNNNLLSGSFSLRGNTNGLVWDARVSHKQATNYRNRKDGRIYGTAFNETDMNGMAGLNRDWGYAHLSFSVFNDLQEVPDGSRDSLTNRFTKQITEDDLFRPVVSPSQLRTYRISDLHQHVQHYKLSSSGEVILPKGGKLTYITGYQLNIRQEFSHPENVTIPGLSLLLNSVTYDIKYYLPELHKWEIIFGTNGMVQMNRNTGTEFIIPDYRQTDLGVFAFIKKNFNRLDISGGLRSDSRFFRNSQMYTGKNQETGFEMPVNSSDSTLLFEGVKRTFSGITGSLGATYNFNDNISVKANLSGGYRSPNITEMSANGVHPGTGIYQIGNLDKPEFSLQEDIGLFFSSHHINMSIELFNNNITNYIFNQRLTGKEGRDSVIVSGTHTYKFQQSDARLYGGEASIDIHPHPFDWLHFQNSVSFVLAENRGGSGIRVNDSTRFLPFIPPLHFHSELRADIKKLLHCFSSSYIKVSLDHYAAQNRAFLADGTETPTPGYTLLDFGIGTDVVNKHGKTIFNIQIAGSNVSDMVYQSHLSRLKYMDFFINNKGETVNVTGPGSGIYNMGRNISLKLQFPLQIK